MGASNPGYVGGSLLAVTILMGGPAPAMEASQPSASTPSLSPAGGSLPSYIDSARLPGMQEAWRPRDSAPASATPAADGTSTPTPAADDATLAAAKAAMLRAEQAGREAAAVRQKAEELSRRFGTDSATAAPAAAADAAPTPADDTATGSIEPQAPLIPAAALGASPPSDPADGAAATAPETVEPGRSAADAKPNRQATPAAATQTAPLRMRGTVTEDGGATADRSKVAPSAPPPRSKTATSETVPAAPPGAKTTPGASSKADVMPASIGAFGWDSQPQ